MVVDLKSMQQIIAYASIVMGVLTQALAGIHLPVVASAILGVFGILLHPDTSVNTAGTTVTTTTAPTSRSNAAPVQGL
jgi:hypothetical protein